MACVFFFSSRRRHTRLQGDWSSDVCSSDLELAAKGMKNTGSENYGGPVVTAGGVLFIAATNIDKKFRAFDKSTGKLLWETTLPFAGNATPATYSVNGRQYIVIAAGGGKDPKSPAGGVYIAFALPH